MHQLCYSDKLQLTNLSLRWSNVDKSYIFQRNQNKLEKLKI